MRIAHRDGPYFNLPATDFETVRISPCRRIERQATRLKAGCPHIYRHDTPALHTRVNEPGRAIHRDGTCARSSAAVEKGGDTARAVATLFDFSPIRIEDAIEHCGVRASGILQDQRLVKADPGVPVAELSELFSRWQGLPGGRIEHDEIVTRPVHLREIDAHAPRIAESLERGTIPEHTAIHHGEYTGPDRPLSSHLVNHAILQP